MERTRDSLRLGGGKMLPREKVPFRRELDFLVALVKVMLFVLLLQIGLRLATLAPPSTILILLSSAPFLLTACLAGRAHNYRWALGAILAACYVSFAAEFVANGTPGGFDALIYLLIPLIVGVLLLTQRTLFILIIASVLCVVLASFAATTTSSGSSLAQLLIGLEFVALLALVTKRYWHLVERDRRAEVTQNESIFHELITNVPVVLVVLDEQGVITLIEGR